MIEWNWWALITIFSAAWVQLVIHETSHIVVGWFRNGHKPTKMIPWPSFKDGRFCFARFEYIVGPKKDPASAMLIAPMWAGLGWCLINTLLTIWAPAHVRIVILPFAVSGLVDCLWFWRGYFWGTEFCDGKRWKQETGR